MRRTPLRSRGPTDRTDEPGYRAWRTPSWGRCAVCGEPGLLLRHHVLLEQHCRAYGAPPYDLRNALSIGAYCRCHRDHHSSAARIPRATLSSAAVDFLYEVLGQDAAELYLERFYS